MVPKNSWNFDRRIPRTTSRKDRNEKYEYDLEFVPVKKNEMYYDSALKFELISIVKDRLISSLDEIPSTKVSSPAKIYKKTKRRSKKSIFAADSSQDSFTQDNSDASTSTESLISESPLTLPVIEFQEKVSYSERPMPCYAVLNSDFQVPKTKKRKFDAISACSQMNELLNSLSTVHENIERTQLTEIEDDLIELDDLVRKYQEVFIGSMDHGLFIE